MKWFPSRLHEYKACGSSNTMSDVAEGIAARRLTAALSSQHGEPKDMEVCDVMITSQAPLTL